MANKYLLTRKVTRQECPWLKEDLEAGKEVYTFSGPTFECIGKDGIAVSDSPGKGPFYEIPRSALIT